MALNPKKHRLNRNDTLEFTPDPVSDGDTSDKEEELLRHLVTPHQRVYKWSRQTNQTYMGSHKYRR
jgi:hypothetical protein